MQKKIDNWGMDDWGFTLFMPHYCSDLRIILYMKIYLILLLFWADGKKYIFFRQLPQHSYECSKYFYLKNDTHVYKYLIRNEKTSEHSHFY